MTKAKNALLTLAYGDAYGNILEVILDEYLDRASQTILSTI